MKITKSYIKQIIKEELKSVLSDVQEGVLDDEAELEKHQRNKPRKSASPSGEYSPRPPVDMTSLMKSIAKKLREEGHSVIGKVNGEEI